MGLFHLKETIQYPYQIFLFYAVEAIAQMLFGCNNGFDQPARQMNQQYIFIKAGSALLVSADSDVFFQFAGFDEI